MKFIITMMAALFLTSCGGTSTEEACEYTIDRFFACGWTEEPGTVSECVEYMSSMGSTCEDSFVEMADCLMEEDSCNEYVCDMEAAQFVRLCE